MPYTIGVDFGTLSARAVVLCTKTGQILAQGEYGYTYYEERLPNGRVLPEGMVLASPEEYLNALIGCVREVASKVDASQIVGIAVDATSLTLVATDALGYAFCHHSHWASEPNAWIKLWKSHSAKLQAKKIQQVAQETGHRMLEQCGGRISDEWAFPKILETFECAPELFQEVDTFWDLCDWMTFILSGEVTRSQGSMCNKFHYDGIQMPEEDFWNRVSPGFGTALRGKLNGKCMTWGEKAGKLQPWMADAMGIPVGISVAAGALDGHSAMAALGLNQDGDCMLTIGTSTVVAVLSDSDCPVRGVCGSGHDAMIPGFHAYDAGQCSVGDTFRWFVENQVPQYYYERAQREKCSIHTMLSKLAFGRMPALQDPIALDWWNGNRCIRGDLSLRGAIYGLSLNTKPEDIYRCLVESTAFGLKNILDNFEAQGVRVSRLRACGGIAQKNPQLMQCYADVLGIPIAVSSKSNAAAVGTAIMAAVAAGQFMTIEQAMDVLSEKEYTCYQPRPDYTSLYEQRYRKYQKMDAFFAESFL